MPRLVKVYRALELATALFRRLNHLLLVKKEKEEVRGSFDDIVI
jgi:hypothetical protein